MSEDWHPEWVVHRQAFVWTFEGQQVGVNQGEDIVEGLVCKKGETRLIWLPRPVGFVGQQLDLCEVVPKGVDIRVLERDLEQVPADSVSQFVPIAQHDREPEELMVIENVHDDFDEVNAHVIELDQELVKLFVSAHLFVELFLLELLDQAFLLELAHRLLDFLWK